MSFNRYQLLQRHIRIGDPNSISCGLPTPYAQGFGATGTARVNCGFYQPFVEAKKADTKGDCWPWGTLKTAPTPDGQVNQFAWKDNALVLFLSTVYSGEEFEQRIRRRPTTTQPRARPIQHEFGDEPVKELFVPSIDEARLVKIPDIFAPDIVPRDEIRPVLEECLDTSSVLHRLSLNVS
ncbi:hypothetical protein HRG_013949 [Hirsutella rhossiliensis]